jgi:hypothetical protein
MSGCANDPPKYAGAVFEIMAIVLFWKSIGRIMRSAGVAPGCNQLLLVALWFAGEFAGALIGVIILGRSGDPEHPRWSVYVLGLVGGMCGCALAENLARRRALRFKTEEPPG